MFDYLEGEIVEIHDSAISLKIFEGISLLINVINSDFFLVKNKYKIFTHLFKTEESLYLYGFLNQTDRFLFSELIKINGIGPKTAINILKKLTSSGLIALIKSNDINALQKISSIGNKADRVYYELKNKVLKLESYNFRYQEVFDALINLGYPAQKVFVVLDDLQDGLDNSSAIKEAIMRLKNE